MVIARRDRNDTVLSQRLKRERDSEVAMKQRLDSECFSLNQKQKNAESDRRSSAAVLHADKQR